MAQSVKGLTSVQVMISRFVGSSPMLGSVLTAQSLELALGSVSPSLSEIINIFKKFKKNKKDRKSIARPWDQYWTLEDRAALPHAYHETQQK